MLDRQGFTLIELMVVVSVLGILSAISVPTLSRTLHKARESAIKANLRVLRGAINMYVADNGTYPTDLNRLVTAGYINNIPTIHVPPNGKGFMGHDSGNLSDAGPYRSWAESTAQWYFFNDPTEPAWYGKVVVSCNHEASDGIIWDEH